MIIPRELLLEKIFKSASIESDNMNSQWKKVLITSALKESRCGKSRKEPMELKFEEKEDTLFLSIKGRVDTTTAPILENSLQEKWTTKNLQMDFKELEYVSSAGLRVFLAALKKAKKQNGTLKLFNINESVMEVFEITGFKKLFQL